MCRVPPVGPMSSSKSPKPRLSTIRQTGSWLALVAAATVGSGTSPVLANLTLDDSDRPLKSQAFHRVIVQLLPVSADGASVRDEPRSSEQRIVTLEQLRRGIQIPLFHPSNQPEPQLAVVAWLHPGDAHLEVDPFEARPDGSRVIGVSRLVTEAEQVQVRLLRRRT